MKNNEQINLEEIERPNSPKYELISQLYDRSLKLSYSSLKNFTSPINFINYKLKKFSKNPSMVFGSLCDVILLTPDKFDEEFKIIDKVPESDLQIAFSEALIDIKSNGTEITDEIIKIEFDKVYKRGDCFKTYELIKEYVDAKASGKELITQKIYDEAKSVCDNLMQNEDIQIIFSQIVEVQKKIEWTENGWDFVGYLDILLDNHIIDLKFSRDSNPDKFERDIANFDYFLQAAMYCKAMVDMGICSNPKYSFIVFDKSFNYSIIELDYAYIKYGERKFDFLIHELERCISEGAFEKSYNFFNKNFKVYKPNWSKGFITDEEEFD